ncbi:hypothetical protein GEV33_002445 [Tenebrio molitor]|uniref:Uncharacterized protein n=1 Tax=Tenebrio molitor TaxID=7067 RepID=A0A8J6HUY6_TENMO|nr:hypothetical protein GEV33_002445 [Tenebrio molitor]
MDPCAGLGSLFLTFSTARKTFQLRTGAYLNSTNSQILIDTLGYYQHHGMQYRRNSQILIDTLGVPSSDSGYYQHHGMQYWRNSQILIHTLGVPSSDSGVPQGSILGPLLSTI